MFRSHSQLYTVLLTQVGLATTASSSALTLTLTLTLTLALTLTLTLTLTPILRYEEPLTECFDEYESYVDQAVNR